MGARVTKTARQLLRWDVTYQHLPSENFHKRTVHAADPDDAVGLAAADLAAANHLSDKQFDRQFRLVKVTPA